MCELYGNLRLGYCSLWLERLGDYQKFGFFVKFLVMLRLDNFRSKKIDCWSFKSHLRIIWVKVNTVRVIKSSKLEIWTWLLVITLLVRRFERKYAIFMFVFYFGNDTLKFAAGDYSKGKEKLITLTLCTFTQNVYFWWILRCKVKIFLQL